MQAGAGKRGVGRLRRSPVWLPDGTLHAVWLGLQPHAAAMRWMQRCHAAVRDGGPPCVALLEHTPVVTAGWRLRGASLDAERRRLAAQGLPLVAVDRGGAMTWHGPGQLVVYPVVRLRPDGGGVRAYVETLANVVVAWLAGHGVDAQWDAARPGVWTRASPPRKIASVGVRVRERVTTHGLALNLTCALDGFRAIRPCGLDPSMVTSMQRCVPEAPSPRRAAPELAALLAAALGGRLVWEASRQSRALPTLGG